MTRRTLTWIAGIALTAACSSSGGGADVNSFPTSLAGSVCHFYYHCCTPVDRQHVSDDFQGGFNAAAATYGFSDESTCKEKLPALFQTVAQPYQEEVARTDSPTIRRRRRSASIRSTGPATRALR